MCKEELGFSGSIILILTKTEFGHHAEEKNIGIEYLLCLHHTQYCGSTFILSEFHNISEKDISPLQKGKLKFHEINWSLPMRLSPFSFLNVNLKYFQSLSISNTAS